MKQKAGELEAAAAQAHRSGGKPITRMSSALWSELQPFYPEGVGMDLPALADALRTKLQHATGSDRLWILAAGIWLGENEAGAWTLMLPTDY